MVKYLNGIPFNAASPHGERQIQAVVAILLLKITCPLYKKTVLFKHSVYKTKLFTFHHPTVITWLRYFTITKAKLASALSPALFGLGFFLIRIAGLVHLSEVDVLVHISSKLRKPQ